MAKVLVVEDDALTAQLVCEVIATLGHAATAASTGEAARAAIDAETAAIVVDVHLGAESGLDLIADFAADPVARDIPVVAMTGDDEPKTLTALDRLGVVALLPKPFAAAEAAALVQAVLDTGPKNKRPPSGGPQQ